MNFETALIYARDNRESLKQNDVSILGIMHNPNDEEASFYIFDLSSTSASDQVYSTRTCDDSGDVCDSYNCYIQSGNIEDDYILCLYFSGNSSIDLANDLPELATTITYAAYTPKRDISNLLITDALLEIFSDLQNPNDTENDWNQAKFKAEAIKAIENLNS